MNIERFHNELALRLGYERIVKDKRIQISVEESEDPWVILRAEGGDEYRIKASDKSAAIIMDAAPELKKDIESIVEVAHQAYIISNNCIFKSFCKQ